MKYQKVKVYATTTCPYCTMVANWLTTKKVPFSKILVDQDQAAAREMIQLTGQMGVPVIAIEYDDKRTEHVIGYNPPQLAYMLGIQS